MKSFNVCCIYNKFILIWLNVKWAQSFQQLVTLSAHHVCLEVEILLQAIWKWSHLSTKRAICEKNITTKCIRREKTEPIYILITLVHISFRLNTYYLELERKQTMSCIHRISKHIQRILQLRHLLHLIPATCSWYELQFYHLKTKFNCILGIFV